MGELFIKKLGYDLFSISYIDQNGRSRAYEENWKSLFFKSEQEAKDWLESVKKERDRADSAIPFSFVEAEAFIKQQMWIFAGTCANTNPHEYIVKKELRESAKKKFERFVATIKANPSVVVINGVRYKDFILGDHYYWIKEPYDNMAAILVCRAKKDYLALTDGIYYYNENKVQEDIKKREQWKKEQREDQKLRSSERASHTLPRTFIDALSTESNYLRRSGGIYTPFPREGFSTNDEATDNIRFGDLVRHDDFDLNALLQTVVGEDINHNPVFCDITKTSNLLVVGYELIECVDSIILSILCKASPEQVRFLLIDTGVIYLTRYSRIPHLITPAICDCSLALDALKWVKSEMNRRNAIFSDKGVMDIDPYNQTLTEGEVQLPRILIVIKDLTHLIGQKGNDVISVIDDLLSAGRLGIHLILTASRPCSVWMKSDFVNKIPGKVVYRISPDDSLKILGSKEADDLSGYGNMLFTPFENSKPIRGRSLRMTEFDVMDTVNYMQHYYDTNYDHEAIKAIIGDRDKDPDAIFRENPRFGEQLIEAMEAIIKENRVSVSFIQKLLGVGYGRASLIISELEYRRYIGPYNGLSSRTVLIDRSEWDDVKKKLLDIIR